MERTLHSFTFEVLQKDTKMFVEQLLHHVVGRNNADTTANTLLCDYVDKIFLERGKLLGKKLDEILAPYMEGYAVPLEDEFGRLASRWRAGRMAKQLQKLSLSDLAQDAEGRQTSRQDSLLIAASQIERFTDGAFDTAERVIDMMRAYYKVIGRRIP